MKTQNLHCRGFTLVETLVVITIIVIVSALAVPALQGLASASTIATAGNLVANLIEEARGNAIAQNSPTAVVVLATGSNTADRVLTLLQYAPAVAPSTTSTWTQASKWYVLPAGVRLDATLTSFLPPNPLPTPAPLPSLTYLGTIYAPNSGYGYFIVLQNGSIFHSGGAPTSPCRARLVPAVGTAKDFYDIFINDSTGHTKIVRP